MRVGRVTELYRRSYSLPRSTSIGQGAQRGQIRASSRRDNADFADRTVKFRRRGRRGSQSLGGGQSRRDELRHLVMKRSTRLRNPDSRIGAGQQMCARAMERATILRRFSTALPVRSTLFA